MDKNSILHGEEEEVYDVQSCQSLEDREILELREKYRDFIPIREDEFAFDTYPHWYSGVM